MPCVGNAVDVFRPQVETEVRTEQQTLDGFDVYECITEDTPHLQAVVTVVIELAQRVLAVAHATYRTREGLAVLFINGHCGGHLQSVLQRLAVNLIRIGDRSILTDGNHLVHLEAGVDTARETFEIGVFQDTFVLLISE